MKSVRPVRSLAPFSASSAPCPNRQRFLTEPTLDPPSATGDEASVPLLDEDYVILSTIHSAKGQEWKSVFLLNCVDGCAPPILRWEARPRSRKSAGCFTLR